tara:strand:- start:1501 stop:2553 length:1053 start_codon:yes stop_codon:yes gene_type:complete
MKKIIGIVGTHGLPANYSGWETLVKHLVKFKNSVDYIIATPNKRKKEQTNYENDISIHIDLNASGWQSIFYDFISMIILIRKCDAILVLGVSGCIFLPFVKLISDKEIIVNTDGIEYRREKWGFMASKFLEISEKIAINYATKIVADNEGIARYIKKKYAKDVDSIIAYGGVEDDIYDRHYLDEYNLLNDGFDLAIARIVPENKIETILNVYNWHDFPLIFVGNWGVSDYSKSIKAKEWSSNIFLVNSDYNVARLNSLRNQCRNYIHGHSAGGTNPSLVEALSIGCNILSYDVIFNRFVLKEFGSYWKNEDELKKLTSKSKSRNKSEIKDYYRSNFSWDKIVDKYESVLK